MVIIGGSSRSSANPPVETPNQFRLQHAIGINDTSNVILLPNDDDSDTVSIVVSVGQQVSTINVADGSMHCLKNLSNAKITCLILSPNKSYIAICTRVGDENQITITTPTGKDAKIFRSESAGPITTAAFSADSKQIVLASSNFVEVWQWEKDALRVSGSVPDGRHIVRIQCSPLLLESGMPLITTSGKSHMRIWSASTKDRISNTTIMPTPKEEQSNNFIDHIWVSGQSGDGTWRLAAVASSETGEQTILVFSFSGAENSSSPTVRTPVFIPLAVIEPGTIIHCISTFADGFVVAGSHGFIGLFQRDCSTFSQIGSACMSSDDEFKCISSHSEKALFASKNKRFHMCSWQSALKNGNLGDIHEVVVGGFHGGSIIAAAFAKARPFMITAGSDKCVRAWDLITNKCIAMVQFPEVPRDVSFHPGGLQVLICFKDRASMYCIVSNGFKKLHDMQGKDGRKTSFSNGGRYYAVAFGRKISVYETYNPTITAQFTLNYHTAPITSMQWSRTDEHLHSASMDGTLYAWSLYDGTRLEDFTIRGVSLNYVIDFSVQRMQNGGRDYQAYLLFDDGSVTKVTSLNNEVVPISLNKEKGSCIRYDHGLNMLLVGTSSGTIHLQHEHLSNAKNGLRELKVNAPDGGAVTCIHTTDTGEIISCHENGNILISSQASNMYLDSYVHEGSAASSLNGVTMVCTEQHQSKLHQIEMLQKELDQMKLDNDLQVQRLTSAHNQDMSRLTVEIAATKQEYTESLERHSVEMKKLKEDHAVECNNLSRTHSDNLVELETKYEDRLLKAAADMKQLKQEHVDSDENLRLEIEALLAHHEAEVARMMQDRADSENKFSKDLTRMTEEVERTEKMRKEMLSQQANEYEKELSQQSFESLKKLQKKQHLIDSVNMQLQSLTHKREQQVRQIKDLKSKINYHQNENGEVHTKMTSLESEIKQMRQALNQKEEELKEAADAMNKMNFQQNVLEKELYIAKAKVDELIRERGPLEESFDLQKGEESKVRKQLQDLVSEKEALRRHSDLQEQNIKIRDNEIRGLRNTIRDSSRKLASLEGEIVHLASISNDKILKSEVKNTYQKFIKGEVTTPTRLCSLSKENQDVTNSPSVKTPDTGNSFNQQSFEKRLKLAENKAKLELKSVKQSLSKRMGENAVLMQECDDLRTQNSELKSEMARLLHET